MAEKLVIIGSGPAGWTAAIYASRASLHPLLFEGSGFDDTVPLGQLALTTEVENFPSWPHVHYSALEMYTKTALPEDRFASLAHLYSGKSAIHGSRAIYGPELMELMRQQAINFGARVVANDIIRVDFSKYPFVVQPRDEASIEAMSVIVSTGAKANYLGLPSEDRFKNRGVSACAVCDGALPRFRNKPIVVIGGGDTAVEEASYLTKFGSIVYLAHRRNELRASKVMQRRAFTTPKITMKWNRVLDEVLGDDKNGVTGVRLKSTIDDGIETLDAAGVFIAIGHTPNTPFLKGQLELDSFGYIALQKPHRTWTSVEGVFAAGDVADSCYRQAITAAGTGCMAALDAERWLAEKGHH
ncbi:MAG: thioredoxin-disulfide reductase [Gemmataceae bacterium]|nr:thioredoxin-disulfide reductase [Gemmataceae bacterium]